MAITTKYCQKELDEYGACVVSHPASWQEKCVDLKLRVAQCTSSQYVHIACFKTKCIYILLAMKSCVFFYIYKIEFLQLIKLLFYHAFIYSDQWQSIIYIQNLIKFSELVCQADNSVSENEIFLVI